MLVCAVDVLAPTPVSSSVMSFGASWSTAAAILLA